MTAPLYLQSEGLIAKLRTPEQKKLSYETLKLIPSIEAYGWYRQEEHDDDLWI